jgi:hypothetical protein
MTPRWAITAWLCALTLPGCLGSSSVAPTGPNPKGYVLMQPPPARSLYRVGPASDNQQARQPQQLNPTYQPSIATGQGPGNPSTRVVLPAEPAPQPKPDQPDARVVGETAEVGPSLLPLPEKPGEMAVDQAAVVPAAGAAQGVIAPEWEKISQALAGNTLTTLRRPSTNPLATLAQPIKASAAEPTAPVETSPAAAPGTTNNSFKLVNPPASAPVSAPPLLPDLQAAPLPDHSVPAAGNMSASSIAASAASPESPLLQAIRAYQNKRPDEAIELLKQYDASNQEMMLYLVPLMVRLSEGSVGAMTPDELAVVVDHLQGATGTLRSKAALRLDAVCFCRRVLSYGKYEALDSHYVFQPGEPVWVYAEVRNFTWEPLPAPPGPDGKPGVRGYGMRLDHTLEVCDATGHVVWQTHPAPRDDVRRTPPADYYLAYRFPVPPRLPPGAYTLIVQVVDKPTGRVVRGKPVEFRIGGGQTAAISRQ